jgi:hypothetical protein
MSRALFVGDRVRQYHKGTPTDSVGVIIAICGILRDLVVVKIEGKYPPYDHTMIYSENLVLEKSPKQFTDGQPKTQGAHMRVITDHIINPYNHNIHIVVTDEPGAGGANHRYEITGFNTKTNDSDPIKQEPTNRIEILFQNGPINEKGVNGITQEVLLAIVADRLRSFQGGPFACRENALALTKIEEAQHWLHARTNRREVAKVEGKYQEKLAGLAQYHPAAGD